MKRVTCMVIQLCCPCRQDHLGASYLSVFLTVFMAAKGEEARSFKPVWWCLAISCYSNTGVCVHGGGCGSSALTAKLNTGI